MSEISAIVSSAIALQTARIQDQIAVSILRANAQAAQAMADLLMQNSRQIKILSDNIAAGRIDLFV